MWLPPDSAEAGQNKAEQLRFLREGACVDLQDSGGVWVWASAAIRAPPRRIHNSAATVAEEPRRADMLDTTGRTAARDTRSNSSERRVEQPKGGPRVHDGMTSPTPDASAAEPPQKGNMPGCPPSRWRQSTLPVND